MKSTRRRARNRGTGPGLVAALWLALWAGLAGPAAAKAPVIVLASTTSTQASGFLDYVLPRFEAETGITVRVVAHGTGHALRLARAGDADVLLVHDRQGEAKLVADGFAIERRQIMANDFVIVGPGDDPAGVGGLTDAVEALRRIAGSAARFVSRGDDSGTHRAERRLWRAVGRSPGKTRAPWYLEAGAGMAATLRIARELGAYTLTDRASWLAFPHRAPLALLVEGDPRLDNPYSVLLVNPARHPHVHARQARALADWLAGPRGQALIAAFCIHGHPAFRATRPPGGERARCAGE